MTGEGLEFVSGPYASQPSTSQRSEQVRTFLNLLPSSEVDADKFSVGQPLEVCSIHFPVIKIQISCVQYSVTEVWSVPYVGTVVNGIMNCGSVKAGEAVLLGPDSNGNYTSTVVKSMQRKRFDVFPICSACHADENEQSHGHHC